MDGKTIAWRATQVATGLVAGLALCEAAFWWRDEGAFAHLNVYEADPDLAVRLRPGAEQRVKYATNPRTSVRINARGFRGADWGPPVEGEVVVVGDSQVFGLGVEEDETASAELGRLRGVPVLNAGVPTYGPAEYLAVIERLVTERHPQTVVLVLNFANDPFELARPNVERHAEWDGWAVRKETAPASVTWFPGRFWLYNRSHAFLALRRFLHQPDAQLDSLGAPSEGSWAEVVTVAPALNAARRESVAPASASENAVVEEVVEADRRRRQAVEQAEQAALVEAYSRRFNDEGAQEAYFALRAASSRASAGDIIDVDAGSEEARSVEVTAAQLLQGARMLAEVHRNLYAGQQREVLRALDAKAAELATRVGDAPVPKSPLLDLVVAAKSRCDASGSDLVVVALPLDVQVSSDEWKKYGAEPIDMTETRVLLTDLVRDARGLGVRAFDATAALAAAEPGAFLHDDLHMTPRGQAALGAAIAEVLAAPTPIPLPGSGLPPGRSRVPTAFEWEIAPENTVRGSSKNRCATSEVREWLRVACTRTESVPTTQRELRPLGIVLQDAPLEARTTWVPETSMELVMPLFEGRSADVDFVWMDHTDRLTVRWDGGRRLAFEPAAPATVPEVGVGGYPERTRTVLPSCEDGFANAGSAGLCMALCDDARPCVAGVCTPWQGSAVCL